MSFEFVCEACGARLRIGDELAGKQVKCPQCSAVVLARPAGETAGESPFGPSVPAGASTDDVNPYASPTAPPEIDAPEQSPDDPHAVAPGIVLAMSQTRPWVLFVSILGFLAGGLMALAAVGMLIGSILARQAEMLIVGPIYALYAAFYLACAYYLFVYGQRIGQLEQTRQTPDLEAALVAQKSFWRLVGITLAVTLVLGLLMMLGVLAFGVAMGGMRR
jgi:DNA-directed RNA polymerase subunit RPC12/RpoP